MNIFKEILRAQEDKRDFAVVTIVMAEGSTPRHENAKMLVFPDGKFLGTIGGGSLEAGAIKEAQKAIKRGKSMLKEYSLNEDKAKGLSMKCGGDVALFIEVYKSKPELFIVGAGHVGKALSSMASMLGFEITVIDDREEWANKKRFPEADNVAVKNDMIKVFDDVEIKYDTYIVIATRGHKHDKDALSSALKKRVRYIGMIGSEKKVKELFEQLLDEGFDKELLRKVYAPIGLDLGGESPEEIALSILAEILMVKNNTSGNPLSSRRDDV